MYFDICWGEKTPNKCAGAIVKRQALVFCSIFKLLIPTRTVFLTEFDL